MKYVCVHVSVCAMCRFDVPDLRRQNLNAEMSLHLKLYLSLVENLRTFHGSLNPVSVGGYEIRGGLNRLRFTCSLFSVSTLTLRS